jgi:hypothetical protein
LGISKENLNGGNAQSD